MHCQGTATGLLYTGLIIAKTKAGAFKINSKLYFLKFYEI
jgi:hypothetical protein